MIQEIEGSQPPLLRWAGSKRASVRTLAEFWKPGKTYVEPFCGSAALFFFVAPKRAVLSDINKNLINFYDQCRSNAEEVWTIASKIPFDPETYYRTRAAYNTEQDNLVQAAYFLYLNRACFNGIYRTNQKGEFNVPYSGKRVSRFFELTDFQKRCDALANASFHVSDFEQTIKQNAGPDAFFFIDPPYAKAAGRVFTEYDKSPFGVPDFDRLLAALLDIEAKGGTFVLTYDALSPPFEASSYGWRSKKFQVTRNVGGFKSTRKLAAEIAITNISGFDDRFPDRQ